MPLEYHYEEDAMTMITSMINSCKDSYETH